MTDQLPRSTTKWYDPHGAEHLITIPAPTVAELLDRLTILGNHLTANDWRPAGGPMPQAHANGATNDGETPPICPVHNAPMKKSKYKGWYCTKRTGDEYCKEKA